MLQREGRHRPCPSHPKAPFEAPFLRHQKDKTMSAEHLSLLTQAAQLAREWDDLAHEAAWNHHQLIKGRITEEAALEAIRSATPDDTFGQLIKSLLAVSNNVLEDLDEIILAAEEMAGGMQRVAPWED